MERIVSIDSAINVSLITGEIGLHNYYKNGKLLEQLMISITHQLRYLPFRFHSSNYGSIWVPSHLGVTDYINKKYHVHLPTSRLE